MAVRDGFMNSSLLMKICFVLLLIASLFNWIAFTTTSWGYYKNSATNFGIGIWRACGDKASTGIGCAQLDGTYSGEITVTTSKKTEMSGRAN